MISKIERANLTAKVEDVTGTVYCIYGHHRVPASCIVEKKGPRRMCRTCQAKAKANSAAAAGRSK